MTASFPVGSHAKLVGSTKSHSIKDMTIPFSPASCIRGCGTYYDLSGRTRIDEMYFKVRGSDLDDVRSATINL